MGTFPPAVSFVAYFLTIRAGSVNTMPFKPVWKRENMFRYLWLWFSGKEFYSWGLIPVGSLCSVPHACQTSLDLRSLEITEPGPRAEPQGRPRALRALIKIAVGLACCQLSLLPFSVPPKQPLWDPWLTQPIQSCWAPENRKMIGTWNFDLCCCHFSKQARRSLLSPGSACPEQAGGLSVCCHCSEG